MSHGGKSSPTTAPIKSAPVTRPPPAPAPLPPTRPARTAIAGARAADWCFRASEAAGGDCGVGVVADGTVVPRGHPGLDLRFDVAPRVHPDRPRAAAPTEHSAIAVTPFAAEPETVRFP